MWIHYPDRIQESVDTLLAQERRLRTSAVADRVKMLRLAQKWSLSQPDPIGTPSGP